MSYEKSTDLIQVGLPVKQSFQQVLRIFRMYFGYMYELTIYMYVCMYVCVFSLSNRNITFFKITVCS